ncbi:DeoR/GlpR family DNA-binding transcription regulator [Spiroplasma endosymbiont of Labia minor]|uniref:DeoR/GlpR family DNA-binding transcription regulator n=1 Tax=Spiroplasma endosymbiont of Labia minor TaxID=3066305 RepID=UPI0030CFB811
MYREERILIYFGYLNKHKFVSTKAFLQFAKNEDIKEITARRDLINLKNHGLISMELGLIQLLTSKTGEIPRIKKQTLNNDSKLEIAKKAVKFLSNDDVIFVSAGTTMEKFISKIHVIIDTLYTNGLEIVREASKNPYIKKIILFGGRFRSKSSSVVGTFALREIEQMRFFKAFFSVTNLDSNGTLWNNHIEEAIVLNEIIKKSNYSYLLLDDSKIGSLGTSKVCYLSEVTHFITNKNESKDQIDRLSKFTNII